MVKETEAERMARLDKEAGARGRVRYSGPKAADRHYRRELDDKEQDEARKKKGSEDND